MNVYAQGTGQRRFEPARHRVGVYLDVDTVARELREGAGWIEPGELAPRLMEIGRDEGKVITACAYGDWTAPDLDARPFRRLQMETRLISAGDAAGGQAWLHLMLDAAESLFVDPRIDVYVLAGIAADAAELLRRLRRQDRKIVLCAPGQSAPPELVQLADRFARLEEPGTAAPCEIEEALAFDRYDWTPFIRSLAYHETRMEFIGIGLLLKKILDYRNCGYASYNRKREVFEKAKQTGILEVYAVPNIDEGADPVSACRLNRENELVRKALLAEAGAAVNDGAPQACGEPKAAQ